jgi:hypothetical protein
VRTAVLAGFVLLVLSTPAVVGLAAAQVPASRAPVTDLGTLTLPAAARVLVMLSDGTRVQGEFAGRQPGSIRVVTRQGNQVCPGDRIARIYTVRGRTAGRGALLGAAIGAAGALVTEILVPDEDFNPFAVFAIVGAVSTPVGAAIGAATSHETLTLVYENPVVTRDAGMAGGLPAGAPGRLYLSAGGGPAWLSGLTPDGATGARRSGIGRSATFALTYRRPAQWGVRGDVSVGRTAMVTWNLPAGDGQTVPVDGTRRFLAGGVSVQRFIPMATRHEVRIGAGVSVVRQTSDMTCSPVASRQGLVCVAGVNALDYFATIDAGYHVFFTDHVGAGAEARFSWGQRRHVLSEVAVLVSIRR